MRETGVAARLNPLDVLVSRSSVAPKTLGIPGPTREEVCILVAAALTAPGRDGLRPYRFIVIEGEGRLRLAQAFLEIRKSSNPRISAEALARSWRKTMRAPTLIGVVARLVRDHPRVPVHEQYVSVGAAIQGILLACHALGYGAIVLSGRRSRASLVHRLLGLAADEEMIGFISIGTPTKRVNPKRRPSPGEYLQVWRGSENLESAARDTWRVNGKRCAAKVMRRRLVWTTLCWYEYIVVMNAKLPGLSVTLRKPAGQQSFYARPGLLAALETPEPRRRRIWELSNNFHCSIVGTCLTTSELRQILVKMRLPGAHKETDHQLHGHAVLLAGQRDVVSKLLQKALDRRHRSTVDRFGKARNVEELRVLWDRAVEHAEIPGAYWAVLTHPHATQDLVRHVFGEVHMLSHLVGAANRADIRRLRELEAENAALQEKVARQQRQLRDAVVSREATIASLNDMLSKALTAQHRDIGMGPADDAERETTARLISDLRQRLTAEVDRREKGDRRLQSVIAERDTERQQRQALERQERDLRDEIESTERALRPLLPAREARDTATEDLAGAILLYVGGRAHQIAQLHRLAEQWNAIFLHHDGGIDDRSGLLEAQVARADRTLFPVDCVSHNAVAVIKRVARSAGKPYVPLRTSGLTSFAAALRSMAGQGQSSQTHTRTRSVRGGC